ncbi:type II toxin-antitoxin system HigB family toxin [Candidatus Poribacteria bacterium]|nr:type II toxin-antitoxin system HigB family toxin [Candidatus Poribacteria bacterium]MXV85157.1 type II toxin-antitoxin system HigB family toxin [Candidatus Poribacteria bacterium]MYA55403.1 type II toxin-antitoxin system HigB family toxin [Candidatus Poribacteria bacterium]
MRIISRSALRDFWARHPNAEGSLQAWYANVKRAKWRTPSEVKAIYRNASFIGNNRVVFNIKGNAYRLVAAINYQYGIVYVRFVGTHQAYNRINAATI